MGGWGSGRRDYASTPTVGRCSTIDIDDIIEATQHPDADGIIYWGDEEDPERRISWAAKDTREVAGEKRVAAIRFEYTIKKPRTGESTSIEYTAGIDYTECNFGGARPWFWCPKCHDRRRKLHLPPRGGDGRYLCRECYGLGYTSSRTSGDDIKQAELRYRRAFAKADKDNRRPHPSNSPFTPDRPKGMHQETFESLEGEVKKARSEWTEEMRQQTKELLDRLQPETEQAEREKRTGGIL